MPRIKAESQVVAGLLISAIQNDGDDCSALTKRAMPKQSRIEAMTYFRRQGQATLLNCPLARQPQSISTRLGSRNCQSYRIRDCVRRDT
mgnify:CR=1 FL=1